MQKVIHISLATIVYQLLITACQEPSANKDNTYYEVAGKTTITLVVDERPQDKTDIADEFSLELITSSDTFLIKPNGYVLNFPKLKQPIDKATINYKSFHYVTQGEVVQSEQQCFYSSDNDSITFIIDHYPFTSPSAKRWTALKKNETYFELDGACRFRGRIAN